MGKKKKNRNKPRDNRLVTPDQYLNRGKPYEEFDKLSREKARINKLIEEREARLRKEAKDRFIGRTASSPPMDLNEIWSSVAGKFPQTTVTVQAGPRKDRRIYFAYGSNLWKAQMRQRCPGSSVLYPHVLEGFKLEFQRHANIVEAPGHSVPGAMFLITPQDEKMLDRYEGVASGSYVKRTFKFLTPKGNMRDVLYYQKKPGQPVPPTQDYLNKIVQGYRDFKLDFNPLNDAVHEANEANRQLIERMGSSKPLSPKKWKDEEYYDRLYADWFTGENALSFEDVIDNPDSYGLDEEDVEELLIRATSSPTLDDIEE